MKQLDFFNTPHETGTELTASREKCSAQNQRILEVFTTTLTPLSPSYVWINLNKEILLTSIRRGITTLTKLGLLKKTTEQSQGYYGKKEYLWRLAGGA